ncbi:MAG TPA: hypothetical protein VMT63_13645 [Bacteroidales bacterium]|nr:hypothetical protein [Bacteroidales bacterium]
MPEIIQTYIICLDDHKGFSEDVKKRFADTSKYIVSVAHNREEFLRNLVEKEDRSYCKVAVIGLHESKENFEMADRLIAEIKKIDSSTGIILLAPPDKLDDLKKIARSNVDSYVPRNSNTLLRIHNTVKKHVSEHSLQIYRRKRTFSFYVLGAFIVISILFAIIAKFRLPMYF